MAALKAALMSRQCGMMTSDINCINKQCNSLRRQVNDKTCHALVDRCQRTVMIASYFFGSVLMFITWLVRLSALLPVIGLIFQWPNQDLSI